MADVGKGFFVRRASESVVSGDVIAFSYLFSVEKTCLVLKLLLLR